jgi:hypothetical protein
MKRSKRNDLKVSLPKMPIVTKGGAVMHSKYLFTLLLIGAVSAGCNIMDRQPAPNVAAPPPYWQSQNRAAQSQLAEMRAFHEKESATISEEMHVFRNREIERLESAGKELEKERLWQEDYEKTLERREKRTSWFKKKNKDDAPLVSEASKKVG